MALLVGAMMPTARAAAKDDWIAYVGTYTRPPSKGIYAWRFQASTGKLTPIGLVAETSNPSFLTVDPRGRFLYAVNEDSRYEGESAGSVSAFSIDPKTGNLKLLNRVSSKGPGPCHLTLDRTGKWLFVANYGGGSVAVYPVRADGSLGDASQFVQHKGSSADRQRQGAPHAHEVVLSADNRFLFVPDLGMDQIVIYKFDPAKGTITPNDPPFAKLAPGSGPRHMAFGPKDRFVYVMNEILVTVTAFRYDAKAGRMDEIQTVPALSTDPARTDSGAEIAVHPNGKFLYSSNRGPNTISAFQIDGSTGKLTPGARVPTQGKTPRNFAIDPTGAFLLAANQDSNSVAVFRIDRKTGALTPTGQTIEAGSPVSVVFARP